LIEAEKRYKERKERLIYAKERLKEAERRGLILGVQEQ